MIVKAAPTSRPMPSTEIILSVRPDVSICPITIAFLLLDYQDGNEASPSNAWKARSADLLHSPEEADLNIRGKLPTAKLAMNIQAHCAKRVIKPILGVVQCRWSRLAM
jgi:hypothetical protein